MFLAKLPRLRKVTLQGPQSLFPLHTFTQLRTLRVRIAPLRPDVDLAPLAGLTRLRQLQLAGSGEVSKLANIDSISCLASLTGLSLAWDRDETIPFPSGLGHALTKLTGLSELLLLPDFDRPLTWGHSITTLQSLVSLDISGAALPSVILLPNLRSLSLQLYAGTHNLQLLSSLTALTALEFRQNHCNARVQGQSSLSGLSRLRHLGLDGCSPCHIPGEDRGYAFGQLDCPSITSLLLRPGIVDSSWSLSACTSLRQLELLPDDSDSDALSIFDAKHLPLQQLKFLVLGDMAYVLLSADLVASGRVQLQQLDRFIRHMHSMEEDW